MAKRRLPKPKNAGSTPVIRSISKEGAHLHLKKGDRGPLVKEIQERLLKIGYSLGSTAADGNFGARTEEAVKEFQKKAGLPPTGEVDEATYRQLIFESFTLGERQLYLHSPFMRGRDVLELQRMLKNFGFNPGPLDGIYGPLTEKALREFQAACGLNPDGIVGASTLRELHRASQTFKTEREADYPSRALEKGILAGRKIALDAGHGGNDPGAVGQSGTHEAVIVEKIADRVAELLKEMEAEVILIPRSTLNTRVEAANQSKSDILVSIHLNGADDSTASGTEVLYFKHSKNGKKLANFIFRELVYLLNRRARGIKPREDLAILKKTRMPAVVVEPLFLTNAEEEALVLNEETQQRIAIGIVRGIIKYFS